MLPAILLVVLATLSGVMGQTDITNFNAQCKQCICNIESNCNVNIGCIMDVGSLSCGPYQIKEPYWIDCGRPGSGWQACANNKACAEQCLDAYMRRYGTYCTGVSRPSCIEFGRIHNGGPLGCRNSATNSYATKLQTCMNSGK